MPDPDRWLPARGGQLGASGSVVCARGTTGNGKSQTITNLIANALAAKKTVLFVAEKQAALDVVQRRLDKIGLGNLCLDPHGKSRTPEDLRKQLRASLYLQCSSNAESWTAIRGRRFAQLIETLS